MTTYREACESHDLAMRRKYFAKPVFGDPIGPWRRWFAWRPVETYDSGIRWLCFVERQRHITHDYLPVQVAGSKFWHYRTIKQGKYLAGAV